VLPTIAATTITTTDTASAIDTIPAAAIPAAAIPAAAIPAAAIPAAISPHREAMQPRRRVFEQLHRERLREALRQRPGTLRRRDSSWQTPSRDWEQTVRQQAVTLAEQWHEHDLSLNEAAALLDIAPRTLRDWRHGLHAAASAHPVSVEIARRGRPHTRCTDLQGSAVASFLWDHGPWLGLPALRRLFPDLPRAELRDLLAVYRYLWAQQHPRIQHVLHWQRVGAVWAMDFTRTRSRIDGQYPCVFAVRDLASGLQLAWRPVHAETTAAVLAELCLLFTVHGAPLVMKSDNGSAFQAQHLKTFLSLWRVWPLYSPPGQPGYNGAIEASMTWMKLRTAHQSERNGHPGTWTSADLDLAREQANTTVRWCSRDGRAPADWWQGRQPLTQAERDAWAERVKRLETPARQSTGLAWEEVLTHEQHAALHRGVLQQALLESGLLSITRRRIQQRFFGQKAAENW
jgi:hypothetical protein